MHIALLLNRRKEVARNLIELLKSARHRAGNLAVLAGVLAASVALNCAAQTSGTATLDELLAQASRLSRQADPIEAIPLLKRAIELAPQNPAANYMLGISLLQSGHPAEALKPLQIVVNADPRQEAAAGYLGDAEMELKDFPAAAQAFELAVAHSRSSEQSLVWWTDFALERYRGLEFSLRATPAGRAQMMILAAKAPGLNLSTRVSLLNQAVLLDPGADGEWGELGMAQLAQGSLAAAESSLTTALQKEAEAATSTLQLKCLIDAAHGHWSAAKTSLIAIRERSAVSFESLLQAWPKRLLPPQDIQGAVWDCLHAGSSACQLPASAPDSTRSTSDRQDFAQGRWETLSAMPAPPPDQPLQWFWRGMAFAEMGNCLQAIPALERGLLPGAEVAAARLSDCYQTEAIRAADRLKAEGKEASVHKIRGDIQLSIHLDPVQAEVEYKAALAIKPNAPEILEKLAEAYFSQGEMKESERAAESALNLIPQRTQILQLLLRIAMADRDYSKAIALSERLLRLEPANQWDQVQQAVAYAQTGQPAKAASRLQVALDAGYPDANGSLHGLLAVQLRKLGRVQDAQVANQAAIKLSSAFQQQPEQAPANQP